MAVVGCSNIGARARVQCQWWAAKEKKNAVRAARPCETDADTAQRSTITHDTTTTVIRLETIHPPSFPPLLLLSKCPSHRNLAARCAASSRKLSVNAMFSVPAPPLHRPRPRPCHPLDLNSFGTIAILPSTAKIPILSRAKAT